MLRDRPGYQQQGFVPPSPSSSPTSSTASKCCAIRRGMRHKNGRKIWFCCCCYCPSSSTSFVTSVGVFILVLGYALLGGFIFMALEGGLEAKPIELVDKSEDALDKRQVTSDEIRSQTVEKLWSITEDLNILYKENWTRLAAQEVLKFQQSIIKSLSSYGNSVAVRSGDMKGASAVYYTQHQHQWSFASSFLYSLTLITTIGYGNVAPRTPWGKLTAIVYAIIGIPLMLIYLSTTGEILSRHFRSLYVRLFCIKRKRTKSEKAKGKKGKCETTFLNATYAHKHNNIGTIHRQNVDGKIPYMTGSTEDMLKERGGIFECSVEAERKHICQHHSQVQVPILFCLFFIIMYICGGAYLFHYTENWTYLEGSFFCFTSLGTIGFGDLMPGLHHNMNLSKKSSASGEIVSVVASSSYILLGMALIAMCFNIVQEQVVVVLKKLTKFFGVISDGPDERDEMEGISMSIVSSTAS